MDAPQIQYAPVRAGDKRRRIAQRLLLPLVLLVLLPVLWRTAQIAWQRAQLLYWQHRAMGYVAPPNHVVFTSAARGSFAPVLEWTRFYELYSPPGRLVAPTLFLHERKLPNGEPRLVAVSCIPVYDAAGLHASVFSTLIKPGSLFRTPQEMEVTGVWSKLELTAPARFFAGQVDPSDPTHFTIDLETEGKKRMTIDGWLDADDTLEFDIHRTPSKR